MSGIDDGVINNTSCNETFEEILTARLSRREVLGAGATATAAASLGGIGSLLTAVPAGAHGRGRPRPPLLGFEGIPTSTADAVVVPPGYIAEVLIAWGDPISDGTCAQQLRIRAGLAMGHAQRRDGVLPIPRFLVTWPVGAEQRIYG